MLSYYLDSCHLLEIRQRFFVIVLGTECVCVVAS